MRHHARRARLARASTAALLVVGLVMAAACTGPPQPPTGPGSNTPCGRTNVQLTNPGATANAIYVAYPTGTAAAPLTGRHVRRRQPPGAVPGARLPGQLQLGLRGGHQPLHPHREHRGHGHLRHRHRRRAGVGEPCAAGAHGGGAATRTRGPEPRRPHRPLARRRHAAVGHPAGRVPRAGASAGLWMFSLAPFQGIGTGPITLPAHTRAIIEAYDQDTLVNRAVGIDLYHRLGLPGLAEGPHHGAQLEPRRRHAHGPAHVAQLGDLAGRRHQVLRHLPGGRPARGLRLRGHGLRCRPEPRWARGPTARRSCPRS